jgi:hypothetical protein
VTRVAKPINPPDKSQKYIPPVDPVMKIFLDDRATAYGDLQDAKTRRKARRSMLNAIDLHDTIMDRLDRGTYS